MNAQPQNWVPETDSFAVRLVLIRNRMKWNAKEAALACGLPAQSWREWELSSRRPRDYEGVCKQIAARTQCDLIWLMTGHPIQEYPVMNNNGTSDYETDSYQIVA